MINKSTVEVEPIKNLNLSISILSLVNFYQYQNGIRVKDYERYIKFCGKKINSLRKEFRITQGKRKFTKISIDSQIAKDSKIINILILDCERKWALGALYNQRLTSLDSVVSEWRYKTKQKFAKATKLAENMLSVCRERCDDQTCQEAEAYYNTMKANYNTYSRKFQSAIDSYKLAKDIYQKISLVKDSIEAFVYKDKIKFITLQIRFCEYNLQSDSKNQMVNNNFEEDEEETEIEVQVNQDTKIFNQISSLSNQEDAFQPNLCLDKIKEALEIRFSNTTIPIKNENVRTKLVKIDELNTKIKNETELTKKQNIFSDVFNLIDDAYKLVKQEKAEKAKDGDSYNQIYNKILSYFSLMKINFQIWKTMIYVDNYKSVFCSKSAITDILDKETSKLSVKPQEMIKLYDNLIQYFGQIKTNDREYLEDSAFNLLNFKELVAGAFKVFYTSTLYLSLKRYEEAYNLLHYFKKSFNEYSKQYELNKFSNLKLRDLDSLMNDFKQADEFSSFIIQKLFVKMTFEQNNKMIGKTDLTAKDKQVDKNAIKCNSWLLSNLKGDKNSINKENYEIFKDYTKISYEEFKEAQNKQTYNNFTHLIQFPPNFQIIYPKPISFDLVHSLLQYPDLKDKSKKEEKKGLIGKTLGYLFGRK